MLAKGLVISACLTLVLMLGSAFLSASSVPAGATPASQCKGFLMGSRSWARCMNGPTPSCPACGINCGGRHGSCYVRPADEGDAAGG